MPAIDLIHDFRSHLGKFKPDVVLKLWRECQPRLLVVTDNLSFDAASAFGLSQFIQTLETSPIHGLLPKVIKASRGSAAPADLPGFLFDDPTNGLLKSRHDVVFLFGFDGQNATSLTASELRAIGTFMQAGGGVFATGDHADLGAALSKDVPRVREMRHWTSNIPNAADTTRLSTNVSGSNEVEDFEDQSDRRPQALYPNFRTLAGNPGVVGIPARAHPLLQLPATAAVPFPVIEVFPDHPHEGECHLAEDLTTTFLVGSEKVEEWPSALVGGRVVPEAVALTMSHGTGIGNFGKQALTPRAFLAVCAYDGHLASVGRVATDATWHHFVNINLDGTGSGLSALQNPGPPPTDTAALLRIRQYYRNLATWLMPQNTRRCLRFPWLIQELTRYPLFEEIAPLPPHPPGPDLDPLPFVRLGEQVISSIALREPSFVTDALLEDALSDAAGDKLAQELSRSGKELGRLGPRDLALGALGATVASVLDTLSNLRDPAEVKPHKTFEGPAQQKAQATLRVLVDGQRQALHTIDKLLARLGQR